ncbi:uncharacterized protein LOC143070225 [Mytilus galloprovincialis]|uniref:Uncharacterized protein n=2 Tax=Mytilus TaxID=6548 RepID=A0A8B6H0P8_MYTGA|nr:Hypothetical predicted protein [Mytilus galloprovincialis]
MSAMSSQVQISPPSATRRLVKTALHQAVLDCRLHQVRLLVAKHNSNMDSKDLNGRTPLMLACMVDEEYGYRMAKILIQAGAFLNLRDVYGRTALSYACMNGRHLIVQCLIREDVIDINEGDNDGDTPLHHATASKNPKVVQALTDCFVKFGLDIDTRNNLGYTALLLACKNGHYASAYQLLVKGRACPTLRDNEVYLNASDWVQKSAEINRGFEHRRYPVSASAPTLSALSFSRESTMYSQPLVPPCQHVKHLALPMSSPVRFGHTFMASLNDRLSDEAFIQGRDARRMLMREIEDYEMVHRPHSLRSHRAKRLHPSTAKLLALNKRSKSLVVPDMTTLFKIYCDQYQPDWRKEKSKKFPSSFTVSSSTSTELPTIET